MEEVKPEEQVDLENTCKSNKKCTEYMYGVIHTFIRVVKTLGTTQIIQAWEISLTRPTRQ